jgi:hypothetical protein
MKNQQILQTLTPEFTCYRTLKYKKLKELLISKKQANQAHTPFPENIKEKFTSKIRWLIITENKYLKLASDSLENGTEYTLKKRSSPGKNQKVD